MGGFRRLFSGPAAGADISLKTILLLDDDEELVGLVKELLESRDFIVTTVTNGAEGLREVMALDFDVIMCDMMMPTMPGDMFYLAVERTKPNLADRFIFITGHSDHPKVMEFIRRTNGQVLYKPVSSDELIRSINIVLERNDAKSSKT